jgi:hypothetical protein
MLISHSPYAFSGPFDQAHFYKPIVFILKGLFFQPFSSIFLVTLWTFYQKYLLFDKYFSLLEGPSRKEVRKRLLI